MLPDCLYNPVYSITLFVAYAKIQEMPTMMLILRYAILKYLSFLILILSQAKVCK